MKNAKIVLTLIGLVGGLSHAKESSVRRPDVYIVKKSIQKGHLGTAEGKSEVIMIRKAEIDWQARNSHNQTCYQNLIIEDKITIKDLVVAIGPNVDPAKLRPLEILEIARYAHDRKRKIRDEIRGMAEELYKDYRAVNPGAFMAMALFIPTQQLKLKQPFPTACLTKEELTVGKKPGDVEELGDGSFHLLDINTEDVNEASLWNHELALQELRKAMQSKKLKKQVEALNSAWGMIETERFLKEGRDISPNTAGGVNLNNVYPPLYNR